MVSNQKNYMNVGSSFLILQLGPSEQAVLRRSHLPQKFGPPKSPVKGLLRVPEPFPRDKNSKVCILHHVQAKMVFSSKRSTSYQFICYHRHHPEVSQNSVENRGLWPLRWFLAKVMRFRKPIVLHGPQVKCLVPRFGEADPMFKSNDPPIATQ